MSRQQAASLSPAQLVALRVLNGEYVSPKYGRNPLRSTTVLALAQKGYIRWHVQGEAAHWKLTELGRTAVKRAES